MPEIRFLKGDTLLFQGPGVLEEVPEGLKIQFESPESRQTWILGSRRIEIISETEMEVSMKLQAHSLCPVTIRSPWGQMETEAAVKALEMTDSRAEVVYVLEGAVHHIRLEWTKE